MTLIARNLANSTDKVFVPRAGWGVVLLAISLFSVFVLAWQGVLSLPQSWTQDEYSHGYLIPVIALYLFSRRFSLLGQISAVGARWPGLMLGILSIALILLGDLTQIPDLATYGLIAFIYALILTGVGFRNGLWFWMPVAYLLFMLPLPNFIYLRLSISLQLMSSEIGVWFIQLFGVPVFLEGNVIDLGVYKLQVAEACSGLRYLFPLSSFCFLFAALYKGPIWQKIVLFLSAAPITILMNSFRIGAIGLLVDRLGIEQADGFLHVFEGWVIFGACVATIFLEVLVLQYFSTTRLKFADTFDLEMVPARKQLVALAQMPSSIQLTVLTAIVTVFALAWTVLPERQYERVSRETFIQFPMEIGNWRGATQELTLDIETVLGADDYLLAEYTNSTNTAKVGIFLAFYNNLIGGSGIHSPQVCLPVGGWEVSRWERKSVVVSQQGTPVKFFVNRALIQRGLSKQLVYFWFEQSGRRTTSSYSSKFYTIKDALTRGRTDAGLVRFVTPIGQSETEQQADERIQEFLAGVLPVIQDFIPA